MFQTIPSFEINFRSTSDGWRGKLAQNFTFSNVELLTKALAIYLIKDLNKNRILIGYDTRFMSEEFANFMAEIFSRHGINVSIINKPSPTPLLTFTTNKFNFPLGINITASHNPPFDNGIKIRMNYGGTPTKRVINQIENYIAKEFHASKKKSKGVIQRLNPLRSYISQIKDLLDFNKICILNKRVLVDTMHGTTMGILSSIFKNTGIKISYLHENLDPYFGGINPEPKFETTKELQDMVKNKKYNLGIAHDGDGDRIIAVHPSYGYLSPHDVSEILLWYLAKYKRMKGNVLGSSTLGRRIKRLCTHLGIEYEEIPVGFKNATEKLLKGEILIAAEENGGVGFGFYLPERDATLAAAKLIEAEMTVDGGLKKILSEIERIAGKSGFCRFNYKPVGNRLRVFQKIVSSKENQFAYKKINNISNLDGIKITYEDGDWLSIRFSGTEDVLRIYCESDSREEAVKIKDFAISQIQKLEK